jgi:hypothetical protein
MTDANYDPRYLKGIRLFNQGDFFECHDCLEELWIAEKGRSRAFYQGLIQAAVVIYHLENGNTRGAGRLLESCRRHLAPYQPEYLGLDVDALLSDVTRCFLEASRVAERGDEAAADLAFVPKIGLRLPA